mgnify:CR=1 FL=1
MQAIAETLFDAVYLLSVITLGIIMIVKSEKNKEYRLFGIMAVILGFGDSFHLIPRAVALCTTGLENYSRPRHRQTCNFRNHDDILCNDVSCLA